MFGDICSNYHKQTANRVSQHFIRLSIAYYKVRSHINRLKVPYIDYEKNILKKAQKLLV